MLKKIALLIMILVLSVSANLPASIASQLGMDKRIVLVALLLVTAFGVFRHLRIGLVLLVGLMVLGANSPVSDVGGVGFDSDYLIAGLAAVILSPLLAKWLDL